MSQVFDLTMYQLLVMNGAFCPEDGNRKLTEAEKRASELNPDWMK